MDTDKCLLCLEELSEPLKRPTMCSCNVYLHKNCLEQIQNTGLLCPICRMKGLYVNVIVNVAPTSTSTFLKTFLKSIFTLFFFLWSIIALCIIGLIFIVIGVTLIFIFISIELPCRIINKILVFNPN